QQPPRPECDEMSPDSSHQIRQEGETAGLWATRATHPAEIAGSRAEAAPRGRCPAEKAPAISSACAELAFSMVAGRCSGPDRQVSYSLPTPPRSEYETT